MTSNRAPRWRTADYLRYGANRLWYLLRAGMGHQLLALVVGIGSLVWLRAHLGSTRGYLGAAVPKIIEHKVPAGATVISQVTATSVRFIEVPLHGVSVLLGTFPRGEGLAHLGAAQSVTITVMRDIYPAGPLVLIAWAVLAITRTCLANRLYPSGVAYIDKQTDRTSKQFFARRLARAPKRFTLARVESEDARLTLVDWALLHGGNHGEEIVPELVALNRYRRQPGFGTIATPATRLKEHWTLVVPKTFGAPLERTVGDGDEVITLERMTVRGKSGTWQAARSGSTPQSPEPFIDAEDAEEDTEEESTALPALPAYTGGPLVAARPAIRPARRLFALLRGVERQRRPIPFAPPLGETSLVFFLDRPYAAKALEPENAALWGLHSMFLTEELGRAAASIAADSAICSPDQADAIASGLASVLAAQMTAQAAQPHGRVVPVRWAAVAPDRAHGLPRVTVALILAHDDQVRATQLGLPAGRALSDAECEALARLAASPLAEVITRACRDLPCGLPLTAMVALSLDKVSLVCARPVTMRHDPAAGWSWPYEPDVSAFHGPWRTGRLWHVAPSRLPGNLTGPRYEALPVNENADGHLVALVTKGGELSLTGDLGLAQRWIGHAGTISKKRTRLGETTGGLRPLCDVDDGKLRIHPEASVDVLVVRLCGEIEARGGGRPGPAARLGVLSVLTMPQDALDARALLVAVGPMDGEPTPGLTVVEHQAIALAVAAPEITLADLGALAEGRSPDRTTSSPGRQRRTRARRRVAHIGSTPLGNQGLLTIAGHDAKERLVVANVVSDTSLFHFVEGTGTDTMDPPAPALGLSLVKRSDRPAMIAEIATRLDGIGHRPSGDRAASTR